MDFSDEGIKILISLLPGFLFIKIVSLRTALGEYKVHDYIVNSLISSLVIYAIVKFIGIKIPSTDWFTILSIILITLVLAILWSFILNKDWLAKVFHFGNDIRLSTHASIYPVQAITEFKGKWHLIRFSDGKEVVGIIRQYNQETHEALIERGHIVLPGGDLSPDKGWYYVPSGDSIIYMRTLEKN